MQKVLLFAMQRSGGSYLSQVLSGGRPILSEPPLPDDGFASTLTENIERFLHFQEASKGFQVVKLCRFDNYLEILQERRDTLPEGFLPICLFRHPFTQIASRLFTFDNWEDPWTPRNYFWDAIANYRKHFVLCETIKKLYPETLYVRYEDTLGENLQTFLSSLYKEDLEQVLEYAAEAQGKNYRLGPAAFGDSWEPSTKELLKKEKYWIWEKLADVMEILQYGR